MLRGEDMNQILFVENSKKGGALEVKTIVKIFSIIIIIFGIILIGQGSFAMFNNNTVNTTDTVPLVIVNQNGAVLDVRIKHDKIIDKIVYTWSGSGEVVLQGKGRTEIEEEIDIPKGTDTLTLKVTDISGKVVSYQEEYELTVKDITMPAIELIVENSKIKIVAKDETALDYIIYYWNDEDETKIEAREDSLKLIEAKISTLKGQNLLTIIAVDKAGNESIKEQTIKGAKKPVISLAVDGDELIIKVTDEEEIKKIEYDLNGVAYSTDPNNEGNSLGVKEVEFRQKLQAGQNIITITAYNIDDLTDEITGQATI